MNTILTNKLISQAVDAILTSHNARHGDYWLDAYDYNPALAVQQCSTVTDSLLEGLLSSPVCVMGSVAAYPSHSHTLFLANQRLLFQL